MGKRPAQAEHILARLVTAHGAAEFIRSNNGSEFIEKKLRAWINEAGIKTLYIDPGSPLSFLAGASSNLSMPTRALL